MKIIESKKVADDVIVSHLKIKTYTIYLTNPYKKLLADNGFPDIRWHDLRSTFCTILLKNEFNPKAVSKLMVHAGEIITKDVYGDKQEIIADCVQEIAGGIDTKTGTNVRKTVDKQVELCYIRKSKNNLIAQQIIFRCIGKLFIKKN